MTEDSQGELFVTEPGEAHRHKPRKRAPRKQTALKPAPARLAAIVKSARDIMRTDEGMNGDLDRLPQLAWLLFLRCLDAKEEEREIIDGEAFTPVIKPEYRWKAWAVDRRDLTGSELIDFINTKLLPYLANLEKEIDEADRVGFEPRMVISSVFKDLTNRMRNGFLLREVIDLVHKVDFTHQDDVHTMAALYEGMLREMRDAAGDSGEFYTPRPVIRFMVQQTFLELGESILDPACGTGGFLVEALAELESKAADTKLREKLHGNLRGIEKKSLPFLLCNMNLLLHDVPQPHLSRANALVEMRKEIGAASKASVILTNPPFGGEEEKSVSEAFDAGFQSRETAWLFLYAILDKLKADGRCAIVLPNGVLFGSDTVAVKIKERLLTECDLHTIVRLQQGIFAPYTDIPANLLFFEKGNPTTETWYYELPLPEGRRSYTKSKPLGFDEFAECRRWWGGPKRTGREKTPHAWCVRVKDLKERGYNLDLTNPNSADNLNHHDPVELVADLIKTEQQILALLEELQAELKGDK